MGESKRKQGWARPETEVREQLTQQVNFIRSSCKSYDAGNQYEAARIATSVFIIVDDGGQRSLLTQLSKRSSLQIYDSTTPDNPRNLLPYNPMISMRFNTNTSEAVYLPLASDAISVAKPIRLVDWWERNSIYDSRDGHSLTRRRLSYSMRSQDGGSHYDPQLTDPGYVNLSRERGPGWFVKSSNNESYQIPLTAHFAMMRVIGWELEKTLVDNGLVPGEVETGIVNSIK